MTQAPIVTKLGLKRIEEICNKASKTHPEYSKCKEGYFRCAVHQYEAYSRCVEQAVCPQCNDIQFQAHEARVQAQIKGPRARIKA